MAPLAVLIFLAYKYWKIRITIDAVEKFLRMQEMLGPTRYAYTDITAITSHFRDKLGQGGYGSVFKGVLSPGNVHVAVKMLDGNSNCNGEDFISEVSTIGRIHHVNVVRLVGFCPEEMRQALVYEYMPRGSLDKYIFSAKKSFSWDKLNEITLGIARGINYLHQGCDMQILHFDIKPHNILLDSNFVPKVADFGLAKLVEHGSQPYTTVLAGTLGYLAPECLTTGKSSRESDVYSFGVVLLEMICCRRCQERVGQDNLPTGTVDDDETVTLFGWAAQLVVARRTELMLDGDAEVETVEDMEKVEQFARVALWCIAPNPQLRPTMHQVVQMLETRNGAQIQALPDPPNCYVESSPLIPQLKD